MSRLLLIVAALQCFLLECCCGAMAQQNPAPPNEAASTRPPAAAVEETRPSIYYLPDKEGKLQPVLDFNYQDFVELYNLKNQLRRRDQPPRFSVQRLSAVGTAGPETAELEVNVQVLLRDDQWVRIPLRFDEGWLRDAPKYTGDGEQFVHCDDDGYVWWLRGKSDSHHELKLSLLVPLDKAGDETRMELFFPRAAASELKLFVPLAEAVCKASEGATLMPSIAKDDGTELNVIGISGEFQLAWSKSQPGLAQSPVVLEVVGAVFTRLDGRWISSDAVLSVRSHSAPFDRFQVKLPPQFELAPGAAVGGYELTTITSDEARNQPSAERLVEVRLARKTAGPVEVRLACRRQYDPAKTSAWCELAGFEVIGAVRQWGTIAVAAAGQWQLLWGNSSDVRQTDQLPESLRKEDLIAGFEYSTQPYSLTVRLAPRKTRISVEPNYVLLVDDKQVRLEAKLVYTIRGAKIATLVVALPGWELEEVGPETIVASDGVTVAAGNVAIPLVQPLSGTVEIYLRAKRAVEEGVKSLVVPLPQPQAVASGPATVTVAPADNVELVPDDGAIEALSRQSVSPAPKLPDRRQMPFYYRSTGGPAVFAAQFRVFPQEIKVAVDSQVTLGKRTAEIRQCMTYNIAYEPVERLSLFVPRIVADAKLLQVVCDGRPAIPVPVGVAAAAADSLSSAPMQVILPNPRIGTVELLLQYSIPMTEPVAKNLGAFSLPLAMPGNGRLESNDLTIISGRNIRAVVRPGPWTPVEQDASTVEMPARFRYTAAQPVHQVNMELRYQNDNDTTLIERAWVQTWLGSTTRQDRAVFRLTTNRKELEAVLPSGAVAAEAIVLINGEQVECRPRSGNRLIVPLVSRQNGRQLDVELQYHFSEPRSARGAMEMQLPTVDKDAWANRYYWQLVLPANEHVMAGPKDMTPEFDWHWRGYFWGRRPAMTQAQLESWSGGTSMPPPSEQLNCYLYSTMGRIQQVEIYTAGRTWIVLWASGAALVVGLLLIYVPASRHPAVLLAAAVALMALGMLYPEPTVVIAQAAGLGLLLTIMAGVLERGAARRRRRIAARKESSSARLELSSPAPSQRAAVVNSLNSTETMPSVQPSGSGNVEP